jgi:toxin ParE1/3/4
VAAERQLHLLTPARVELVDAARRYEQEREGLGDAFLKQMDRAVAIILAAPERWPLARGVSILRGARRYPVHRFPYGVIYRLIGDGTVEIVAIAHNKRRPGYWGSR